MLTLGDAFEKLYRPHKLRLAAPSTLNWFRVNLRHFDRHLGRAALVSDLNDEAVAAFVASVIERGNSPCTANKARSNLLAVWRFLHRRNIVKNWPDVDALREPHRCPRAWTANELTRLFRACQKMPGTIGNVPAGAWWHTLHLVAWDSGERITALLGTYWDDLDLAGRWLHIPAERRKGKHADMLYRLHPETVRALRAASHPARPRVWPWPYHADYLWTRYAAVLKRAGLPADRHSKFHRMRRSVASHAKAAGLDATLLLGHSHPKVTAAYLDERIVTRPHAADVLFRPG